MFDNCNNCVHVPIWNRRQFLSRLGMGFGALGLATLLGQESLFADGADAALTPLSPKNPPLPSKAKRVIHIFANGAPSHVDTWDPKPSLAKYDGQPIGNRGGVAMPSPFKFQPHGASGIEVSEVFPKIAEHVDEMSVIRSMYTDIPAHEIATVMMNTGSRQLVKPCLGSWAVYGLGTENQNMPGFISLHAGGGLPAGGTQNWGAAFLPGVYQGTSINTQEPSVERMIENIRNPYVTDLKEQRRELDLVHQLNEIQAQNLQKDAQLEARIEAYEIAFKMQTAATDAFDINKESSAVRQAYGDTNQGRQMLIARRLLERGVRFVQVWAGGWDHHQDIETKLPQSAREIDQPVGAFLADLKQRGLLDSTLVIWGGEFGRTIYCQGKLTPTNYGRDHHPRCFTQWMAGGGIKPGLVIGKTDDYCYNVVEDPVHVHDIQATILHCLGVDHKRLTYRYQGRDFRLTDVAGEVVTKILT